MKVLRKLLRERGARLWAHFLQHSVAEGFCEVIGGVDRNVDASYVLDPVTGKGTCEKLPGMFGGQSSVYF